jgi:predicted ester cyclase
MHRHVDSIREANRRLLVDGDLTCAETFFGGDYVAHVTDRDIGGGVSTVRRIVSALRRAFTDLEVEVEILVEGEDRVAWQRTLRAVHAGAFQGFPPTARPIRWRDMHTSRFEDGRIVEEWVVSDLAEQLLRARRR